MLFYLRLYIPIFERCTMCMSLTKCQVRRWVRLSHGIPICEDHDQLQLSSSFLGRLGQFLSHSGVGFFLEGFQSLRASHEKKLGWKVIERRKIKRIKVLPSLLRREPWFNHNVYHSRSVQKGSWGFGWSYHWRYLRHFVDHSLHGNSSHHPQHLGWLGGWGLLSPSITETWVNVKWLEVFYGGC